MHEFFSVNQIGKDAGLQPVEKFIGGEKLPFHIPARSDGGRHNRKSLRKADLPGKRRDLKIFATRIGFKKRRATGLHAAVLNDVNDLPF